MKRIKVLLLLSFALGLVACGNKKEEVKKPETNKTEQTETKEEDVIEEDTDDSVISIELSNSSILVEGEEISEHTEGAVYKANDIIFYLEGQGITYGEGDAEDEHFQAEADAHTVVHITEPGTYEISGKMEAGQIFVDLGEDAEHNENAVVNLILNDVDITCTVAPAIFFYNVYECSENDVENASMDVDLSSAGANLILADGTTNEVYGSYVAKIYKSYELNEEGTEVVDSKKLHKYDAAVYSKMSMNVIGDTGVLNIKAENEGLDTELHLAIQGGEINIASGNDGINVNEDGVSVFAMNGGNLNITVSGETGEGDGIDSNGWLVVNGGNIQSYACETSMDSGIDADNGIYINGGTVIAGGNMNAELAEGMQQFINFNLMQRVENGNTLEVKDAEGSVICEFEPTNIVRMYVVSVGGIEAEATYGLWLEDTQVAEAVGGASGGFGMRPGGFPGGEMPEGMIRGEEMQRPMN